MKLNKFLFTLIVCALSFGFASCSDDDDENDAVELSLEKNEISIEVEENSEVKITSGNGEYTITSADDKIATAKEASGKITVTGVAAGETTITVKDKKGKTASLKVTVEDKVTEYSITGVWNVDKIEITAEGEDQEVLQQIKDEIEDENIISFTLNEDKTFKITKEDEDGESIQEGTYTFKDGVLTFTYDDDDTFEINAMMVDNKLKMEADRTEEFQYDYPEAGITKVHQYVELSRAE